MDDSFNLFEKSRLTIQLVLHGLEWRWLTLVKTRWVPHFLLSCTFSARMTRSIRGTTKWFMMDWATDLLLCTISADFWTFLVLEMRIWWPVTSQSRRRRNRKAFCFGCHWPSNLHLQDKDGSKICRDFTEHYIRCPSHHESLGGTSYGSCRPCREGAGDQKVLYTSRPYESESSSILPMQ